MLLCRQRGYRVGSLKTGIDEPDKYYKQPGHPLSDAVDQGGRFDVCILFLFIYIHILFLIFWILVILCTGGVLRIML